MDSREYVLLRYTQPQFLIPKECDFFVVPEQILTQLFVYLTKLLTIHF